MDRDRALSVHNLPFLEGLYEAYQRDPSSVPPEWIPLLRGEPGYELPATPVIPAIEREAQASTGPDHEQTFLQNRVKDLIEAYRIHGHLGATIDPLGRGRPTRAPMLDPANFGLGEEHLDRRFHSSGLIPGPAT